MEVMEQGPPAADFAHRGSQTADNVARPMNQIRAGQHIARPVRPSGRQSVHRLCDSESLCGAVTVRDIIVGTIELVFALPTCELIAQRTML